MHLNTMVIAKVNRRIGVFLSYLSPPPPLCRLLLDFGEHVRCVGVPTVAYNADISTFSKLLPRRRR